MKFVPKRLSTRLILILTTVVALVEGISGYYTARVQEEHMIEALVVGADQLSRGISSATWQAMLADHRTSAYEIMQTIALKQGIRRIRIFNKEGRIMFSTEPADSGQVDKRAEACYVCHASESPLVRVDMPSRARLFTESNGNRSLALVTPIYNEPSCSEAACHAHPREVHVLGVLDVALDARPVDAEVASIWEQFIATTIIGVLLISFVIVVLMRQFVGKPIQALIEGTRKVSEMHLDSPVEFRATTELADLAASFNVMRDRLNRAMRELNSFTEELEAKVEERTQQLKVANQRLVQTDRMVSLGQLCASVAHEINNPVSGVLNFSMLMRRIMTEKGIPPGREKEFQEYLSRIIQETSRVGRIVTDLLAFSRRSSPRSEPTNLNRIVESTLTVIAHKLKLMHVELRTELDTGLPQVPCDPSQIQQVIINLVMNGAEALAGHEDGMVVIRTRRMADGSGVELQVEDNGEGIPEEFRDKVFDPFFTTKEEGKGVGLGLAVVYGIIEAHGGIISVESERGKGTVFTVNFPFGKGTSETAGPPDGQTA